MNEIPREVVAGVAAIVSALLTFLGVKVKNRRDDAQVARDLRDELRDENAKLKERVETLENLVQQLLADQIKWQQERLILKRALDKRDARIAEMETRLASLEDISEPMEI